MKNKRGSLVVYLIAGTLVVLVLLFFIVPSPMYKKGFENLNEVLADAASKEELAAPESLKDHRRPSWKTYHSKTQPGFVGRKLNALMSWIGIRKRPAWSASFFKNLLDERIKAREAKGLSSSYEYVHRLVPTDKSRFVIWGDMYGAYHTLTRSLKKLNELGILDDDLKIKSKDDYFVWMGDVNMRSPFVMELLSLIMKLDSLNEDRIIYMAGNNERGGSWYPLGLREEISFKAPHLTSEANPLYKTIEKYFETLPLGVYASVPPHQNNDFVRMSHFSMVRPSKESYRPLFELLRDEFFSAELLKDRKEGVNKVIKLSDKPGDPDPEQVNVRAIIKAFRKTREYQENPGLLYLVPEESASAWTLLSAPTVFVQKVLNFYNDSFSIVEVGPKIEDWTITLYYRDIRGPKEFKTKKFNFLSGKDINGQVEDEVKESTENKAKNFTQDRPIRR